MAQDQFACLSGKVVAITNLAGTFRACGKCGHTEATVSTEPVGMHHGHLECTKCGNLTAFLGRDHLAAMLAAHGQEGVTP